jgi:glycine/D-amino acid oxidase-like deaminating enzyme
MIGATVAKRDAADLVVVGAGTLGGWASVFASELGAERVIALERDLAGQGASSRAAGVVRQQGGTPDTVRLGTWSVDFYRSQPDRYGTDSGFRELGYAILAVTAADERAARDRIAMQRATGLDARWLGASQLRALNSTMASTGFRGGSYVATDGCVDPPRNVRAYSLAMQRARVVLRERTPFMGLHTRKGRGGRRVVTGVETPSGVIATSRVLLTGGPSLREVARVGGARAFVGGARHQVAVSEPHEAFGSERQPMMFDLGAGLYWRLEEGGLLWGMSNPNERPGPASELDQRYLRKMQRRLARFVPVTRELGIRKAWAATIEYTPDHLPLLGPLVARDGTEIEGASIACASGHGMMWGPAAARIAADLALEGSTDVVQQVEDFRMDRFDDRGRSPFTDPVALPFPVEVDEDE